MGQTFGSILQAHRGLGPGFDFLRIALAVMIVFSHTFLLTGNDDYFRGSPLWFLEYALVPMFFALSGFLIAGSAQRLSLKNFLINRGLRIVPALAVDIVVCALIIGPIVTTVALYDYFTNPDFGRYFLNIVGWMHYFLPGVFKENFNQRVNGALWTVPWEILCYIIMSALMLTRLIKAPVLLIALTVAYVAVGILSQYNLVRLPWLLTKLIHGLSASRGSQLILAFLLGIVAYQLRDRIRYSKALLAGALLISAFGVYYLQFEDINRVPNRIVFIPVLVYLTIFIGLTPIKLPEIFHRGDYSYGVYLYHIPFLQLFVLAWPSFFGTPLYGAFALFVAGILPCFGVAVVSWHLIEKPVLGLRKKFSFVAQARGVNASTSEPTKTLPSPLSRSW